MVGILFLSGVTTVPLWCFLLGQIVMLVTDPELKHLAGLAAPVRDVPVLGLQKRERIWVPRVT